MAIRILLIDDNRDQITITARVLAKANLEHVLDSAASATEGIGKVAAGTYDIILCDYRLPDLSGIEMLKRLMEMGRDHPFILVTSMGNERVAVEAMKLGAYDYVVKDASYEEVLPKVILQSLERYQDKRERQRLEAERNEVLKALKSEKDELVKMNSVMINREERVVELKQQVNALLKELGRPPQYRV